MPAIIGPAPAEKIRCSKQYQRLKPNGQSNPVHGKPHRGGKDDVPKAYLGMAVTAHNGHAPWAAGAGWNVGGAQQLHYLCKWQEMEASMAIRPKWDVLK